ncbi:MAG: hypothetical protein JWM32_1376 [Verrucomicrobia bacterium]|nr:hypothetical protein [Verrucomicrobiota bacterium]
MITSSRLLMLVLAGSVLSTGLLAQTPPAPLAFPAASPSATLKQRVGLTDIEVDYSRPSVKGRVIFGGLEAYGKVWRTGANTATKITFSTPVKFGGADVPAGSYALYSIPGETEWTVILNKVVGQWGAYSYDQKNDLVRVTAKPVKLVQPIETFTIEFNELRNESAQFELVWEKTLVPVKIEVDLVGQLVPQIESVMSSSAAKKPYASAAMFYYEQNLDLKKAVEWMDAALKANPDAFYLVYRKALILEKMGDKAGAIATAEASLAAAKKDSSPAKDEYVRLNEALLARLR